MGRLIWLVSLLCTMPVWAEVSPDEVDKEQTEMVKEKMEEAPTSTTLGGSRGGSLEIEKEQDDEEQRNFEKQRQLYEYEGQYRRGL